MKITIDIQDNKADFVMELLANLPFVKMAEPIQPAKDKLKKKIASAVKEINLINAGKRKGTPAKDFLNAL